MELGDKSPEMPGDNLVATTKDMSGCEYGAGRDVGSKGAKRRVKDGNMEVMTGAPREATNDGAATRTVTVKKDVNDATKKMESKSKFTSGNPCFAKVKGYCAYPAKVVERSEKVKKEKYFVKFYGTEENALLDPNTMWPVTEETIKRFVTPGTLKRWKFKQGFEEMMKYHGLLIGDSEDNVAVETNEEGEADTDADDEFRFEIDDLSVSYSKSSFPKVPIEAIDDDMDSDEDFTFDIGEKAVPHRKPNEENKIDEDIEIATSEERTASVAEKSAASDEVVELVDVVEDGNEQPVSNKASKKNQVVKKAKKNSKSNNAAAKKRGKTLREDESDLNRLFAEKISVNDDGSFTCKDCPDFATVVRLLARTHAKTCGTVKKKVGRTAKRRPCTVCGTVCEGKKGLNEHFRVNHSTVKYTCSTCFRKFERRKNYLGHLKIHDEQNKIRCPKCPKTFLFKSYLKRHMKRTHADTQVAEHQDTEEDKEEEERHDAAQSGDGYSWQFQAVVGDAADSANYIVDSIDASLIVDGEYITGDIEITVETGSGSGGLDDMNETEAVIEEVDNHGEHEKTALLSCQKCGESGFRNTWYLNRHTQRMHNLPIKCEICQCVFVDKYWYIKHSSSCVYVCSHAQCNFFTKKKERLDNHMKKHMGI